MEFVGSEIVREFSSVVGIFDVDTDLVVIVDWVNAGISKGYWFRNECLVEVRMLDTGFE